MSEAVVQHKSEERPSQRAPQPGRLRRILESDLFYSFRRSRITMIAAVVTLLFFLLAIFASMLAVQNVDIPIMAAYLLMVSLIFVTINLVVDILYTIVDPRLRSTVSRAH